MTFAPPAVDQDRFLSRDIPSAVEGAHFLADITVQWRGGDNDCVDTIRRSVRELVARKATGYRVTAAAELADLLNAQGSIRRRITGTKLVITQLHVRLTASMEAQEITAAWEEAQREEAREKLRQRQELQRLRYLRDEIFGDPNIARMYWHLKHPTDISALTSSSFDEVASRLSSSTPTTRAPAGEQAIATLIGEFLAGLEGDERAHLVAQLGVVFRSFHRTDLAERLPSAPTTPPPRPTS
ncbi:hypothetical protein [Micromonospora polyrhachis]|uniref:Uncharacterized protein n=1 Tax=Micromonospora polyrhachis TaxID=1282883 RepID=A0A7W7WPG9_9ACTN|nr:hypothetical protein [Micromonospora polyrhachis]MBB4958684.1 hypothetical protein [Micromonospora polyrhachis]